MRPEESYYQRSDQFAQLVRAAVVIGPVKGYTPGGIGLGGVEVAPGNAARDVPVYRKGAGGVRVLVTPHRKRKELGGHVYRRSRSAP